MESDGWGGLSSVCGPSSPDVVVTVAQLQGLPSGLSASIMTTWIDSWSQMESARRLQSDATLDGQQLRVIGFGGEEAGGEVTWPRA